MTTTCEKATCQSCIAWSNVPIQSEAAFTERDWFLLFGHPQEKVFTLRLWVRFAALLLTVLTIGIVLGLYVLPYGLGWFVGALILAAACVLFIAPKWLR